MTFLVRAIGWILFGLLILLSVLPQGSTRVFTWPWTFYAQVLLLSPFVLLAWRCLHRGARVPFTLYNGGALIVCAASIGVSALRSRNPHFSFEAALTLWGGLVFTGWLAHTLRDMTSSHERFRTLARIAGLALTGPLLSSLWLWLGLVAPAVTAAESMNGLIAAFGSARNPHPFGHPNYIGGYALLALPWLAALAWTERGRWRAGWSAAAGTCPVLIFSSASRGAILGTLALVATALVLAWASGRLSRRAGFRLLVAGIAFAGCLALTNTRVRALLTDWSALQYPSLGDVQRLGMLQGGWLLGQQRPWVGHGPGMIPFVYPEVRGQLIGGVETSYQLHNTYLHLWATTGLLGLAAGLVLVLSLVHGVRRWLRQPPGVARTFAMGSAAALVGYAVMAATDYQLDVIGIVAALCVPAALLLAAPRQQIEKARVEGREVEGGEVESRVVEGREVEGRESERRVGEARDVQDLATKGRVARGRTTLFRCLAPRPSTSRSAFGILLLGIGLAAAVFLTPHWRARERHWSAWVTTVAGVKDSLQAKLRAASAAAPWNVHYRNQLGLQLAMDAYQSGQAGQRERAREVLRSSLALDDAQEPIHATLAWLWLPDDPIKAAVEFRRALALIPDRETLHHGLAMSCLNAGDEAGAIRALALECLVNPPFIASPLWAGPELRLRQEAVTRRLSELLRICAEHPAMPRWRQRDLQYFGAFLRWWKGGAAPSGEELAGADERQRAFFAAVAVNSAAADYWPAPWNELVTSSAHAADGNGSLLGGGNPAARDGAMARLQAGQTTIPQWVRRESPTNVGIIGQMFVRGHYPLMHRNLDGPAYLDLAPRITDAFAQRYAEPLFPPRGLIPGPVLNDLD